MAAGSRWAEAAGFGAEPRPDSAAPKKKKEALSVSAAVRMVTGMLKEHTFRIVGEVSELSDKAGYKAVYFTIKDADASLSCLMWKNRYKASGTTLTLGAKVEVTGKFSIFAAKGRMNFDVSHLVLAGDGDLRQRVARLAEKLKGEGLMDASRKRSLPAYPATIGLVTSPRGAAVHDVLRTLRRRYPTARIKFAGVTVEGTNAPRDLIAALSTVAASGAEVICLVRGGGSFEDLMPFNDEGLARAIASCPVPVVTGIGHEPDTSIADMVADVRASTPTGAAQAASPDTDEIVELIDGLLGRMTGSLTHRFHRSVVYVDGIASRPLFKDPASLFAAEAQGVDALHERLDRAGHDLAQSRADRLAVLRDRLERTGPALLPVRVQAVAGLQVRLDGALPRSLAARRAAIDQSATSLRAVGKALLEVPRSSTAHAAASLRAEGKALLVTPRRQLALRTETFVQLGRALTVPYRQQAAVATARLNDLSPLHILERGWSIALDEGGNVVSSVTQAKPDDLIKVQLSDGSLACRVEGQAVSELSELISLEENHD